MSKINLSPAEMERRNAAVAADKARHEYFSGTTNAGQPWAPSTRGLASPEPGAGSVLSTYEAIFAREIAEATPSVLNSHTAEHLAAVKADVALRRAELHAAAQSIASRKQGA